MTARDLGLRTQPRPALSFLLNKQGSEKASAQAQEFGTVPPMIETNDRKSPDAVEATKTATPADTNLKVLGGAVFNKVFSWRDKVGRSINPKNGDGGLDKEVIIHIGPNAPRTKEEAILQQRKKLDRENAWEKEKSEYEVKFILPFPESRQKTFVVSAWVSGSFTPPPVVANMNVCIYLEKVRGI